MIFQLFIFFSSLWLNQNLDAEVNIIQPSCFGVADGAMYVEINAGTPPYMFNWAPLTTQSNNSDTINDLSPGLYTLTITDGANCIQVFEDLEIVYPDPLTLNIESEDATCPGEKNGSLKIIPSGGNPPYEFSIDGGENWQASSAFLGLGSNIYTIDIRDNRGCIATTQATINELELGSMSLGPDTIAFFNQSMFLDPIYNIDSEKLIYIWDGSDLSYLSCSDCPNPQIGPIDKPLNYTLTVIDENGCVYEDQIQIDLKIFNYTKIPTAFTPNNDGENDLLSVFGSSGSRILEFSIYDKYGALVYREKDFNVNDRTIGWDGRYNNGDKAENGTYLWTIELIYQNGSLSKESGATTLIR